MRATRGSSSKASEVDLHLAGKTALVTGASKGIGLAITRALLDEGARVVAGALKGSPELTQLSETRDVLPVSVDLTTPDGPRELVTAAVAHLGGIDVLVNNVGAVRPRLDGFLALTDDDWEWALTINFLAAARTMRAAVPHMRGRPGANIVTVSSVNAFLPDPGVIDYSAAKAALSNLCKSLSKELAPDIRVNTISPGPVQTDLWLGSGGVAATVGGAKGTDPGEVVRRQEAQAATGRFTYPSEVADLVVFLASDRSANTTGSDLLIDGGLITTL
jgi:NAD(P)-dependent dehydrogenase (short-subunit alcohol dehydrogenase family)